MVSTNGKSGSTDMKEDKKTKNHSNLLNSNNGLISIAIPPCSILMTSNGPIRQDNSILSEIKETEVAKRIGKAYQAEIPEYHQNSDEQLEKTPERALLVWAPNSSLTEPLLEQYLWLAKDKYGYNAEQALGMLFWHRHDLERATSDLANFTPFPDEWTTEDKVLFEQAFMFHGKNFGRIRQMLPDKSIAQLVKYYYLWKKTRQKNSLLDKHCKKHAMALAAQGTQGKDQDLGDESDGGGVDVDGKEGKLCQNCTVPAKFLYNTSKGMQQCLTCYNHWKSTGSLRPTVGPLKRDKQLIKHKRHPPQGMYLNHEDLLFLATSPEESAEEQSSSNIAAPSITAGGNNSNQHPLIKHVENEVIILKRAVQTNKADLSYLRTRVATAGGIAPYRTVSPAVRLNAKWSNDELLLAVQGVRHFGRNFKAIAEIIGNKSENHVRSFFATHRKRYNLDQVVKDWEADYTSANGNDQENSERMEVEAYNASPSTSTSRGGNGIAVTNSAPS